MLEELTQYRVQLESQNRILQETQAELERSVRRYADLYDHLPLAYLTATVEGRIVQANLAASERLQRERPRLIGSQLQNFLDAYDAGRVTAHLENCARSGRPSTIELTLRLPEGSSSIVQLSSRLGAPGSDGVAQLHIGIVDMSKLKEAHRLLEDINREQEAFNYSISHDLRAPLVTISNYAGIVLSDHAAGLNPEGLSMLQRIQMAALRMETTLKSLLHYSTMAREEIVLGPVNVDVVVTTLLTEHAGIIEESKAQITVARPLPIVRASPVALHQALANLLTNALKYTEPGRAPRVHISAEARGLQMILKVADEGIGIEPKFHERIFQIFERLNGYNRYPGSGVGLAIARRAVERMHGLIWVESQPGQGSCFQLELPAA
jgi:signal transduction histidine kinase